ncbi:hypothetical protein OROGR_003910 [Orobanche gracilis]
MLIAHPPWPHRSPPAQPNRVRSEELRSRFMEGSTEQKRTDQAPDELSSSAKYDRA